MWQLTSWPINLWTKLLTKTTVLDEASVRARKRIVRHYLVHPAYRDAVAAYEALKARINIGMVLTVLAGGVLIVLV